jgi:2-polyprenyl-3-methyl-5-hydroxy-6-metoxy-1,4-benzoquinol methylase
MVVSKLGDPECVILTDGDEQAIHLIEKNLSSPTNAVDANVTKTTTLRWGETQQLAQFSDWCRSSWPDKFSTETNPAFDYIIAGDVMYKAELPELFFETVLKLLKPKGTLWLCHIPRASVGHDVVIAMARTAGEFHCMTTNFF